MKWIKKQWRRWEGLQTTDRQAIPFMVALIVLAVSGLAFVKGVSASNVPDYKVQQEAAKAAE